MLEYLIFATMIFLALAELFFIYLLVSVIRAEYYRRKLRDAIWMEDQLRERHGK